MFDGSNGCGKYLKIILLRDYTNHFQIEDDGSVDRDGVIAMLPDGPTKAAAVGAINTCGDMRKPNTDDSFTQM